MRQIKVETRKKQLIEQDGLQFKDLNANGILDPYEDWRLPVQERVENLVSQMTLDEKIGLMFIRTLTSGYSQKNKELTSYNGIIDEETKTEDSIFDYASTPGTSEMIHDLGLRHFIFRESRSPEEIASWINAVNEICESSRLGIPAIIASNSRNERGEEVFGMNDAVGVFTSFSGTLGLAATAQGYKKRGEDYTQVFSDFAKVCREEWLATGLRKGYMYMLDVVTDPRWQRIYGTFGEDVDLIREIAPILIKAFQDEELNPESVALTMKHFPGGGARENGFDPHYEEGKYNVYATKDSLEKYHMPPFETAVAANPSSIMPYYSIPSKEKSSQQSYRGKELAFEPYGFAFNRQFLQNILREELGFKGYINSDSGIINKMCWGVEELEVYERAAKALDAGVDLISDSHEVEALRKAYDEGLVKEERLNTSAARLLTELFELGLFDEKTYVEVDAANRRVKTKEHLALAKKQHEESIVLLKNRKQSLPLLSDSKIYLEAYTADKEKATTWSAELLEEFERTSGKKAESSSELADVLVFFIRPQSGHYFHATPGLLELNLVEHAKRTAMDGSSYEETTLVEVDRLIDMLKVAREKGKKSILCINFSLPWILERVEPFADAILAGFESNETAYLDIIMGNISPKAALPLTLPANEEVIEVEDGICASPNDVPGYEKHLYMKDGLQYAYKDEVGNEYKLGFGLSFEA